MTHPDAPRFLSFDGKSPNTEEWCLLKERFSDFGGSGLRIPVPFLSGAMSLLDIF